MKALSLLQEPHTWALVEPPPSMEHRGQYLLQGCEADLLSQTFELSSQGKAVAIL